jgi:hypothetical protein
MARVIPREGDRAYVELECHPHKHTPDGPVVDGGKCWFRLKRSGFGQEKDGSRFWAWNGNVDEPTINPSIFCLGCKKHVTVIKGAEVP